MRSTLSEKILLMSLPSRGAWIEISRRRAICLIRLSSHPSRGAWIEIGQAWAPAPKWCRRTPHGVRGLKYGRADPTAFAGRRTPHGVRGLK